MSLTLQIQSEQWRKVRGLQIRLKEAVAAALAEAEADESADLTLLLTTDKRVQKLNLTFRNKSASTNVLSFPSAAPGYLGDIAIAYGVTAQEAKDAGKTLSEHAIHLTVHGVLHLLGYDHVTPRKANVMEPMETRILKTLNIADPYQDR